MYQKFGGLYSVSFDPNYLERARESAASLRSFYPNLPIALVTDLDVNVKSTPFDRIIRKSFPNTEFPKWGHALLNKIRHLQASPYELTLYLDADTLVCHGAIQDFPTTMQYFDIAMAECRPESSFSRLLLGKPMYNCGVILYRKCAKIKHLLHQWENLTIDFYKDAQTGNLDHFDFIPSHFNSELKRKLLYNDQTSMMHLLSPDNNRFKVRFLRLPYTWNYRGGNVEEEIVINHRRELNPRESYLKQLPNTGPFNDRNQSH